MRAFWPAIEVTEISDDWYRSTIGGILISLQAPQSAGENFVCTWQHLEVSATNLGAPTTKFTVPATTLGALPITIEQSVNSIFFRNAAGAPGNHSYYLSCNDF
jgi:hypothetical protein